MYLVDYGSAAIHCHYVYAFHVFCKRLQVVGNLQAQLACGAYHYGLRASVVGVGALQQWYAKRRGLAGAGLREGYHVVAFSEEIGYHFFLYGHWMLKAQFADGAPYLAAHAQFFKCLQCGINMVCKRKKAGQDRRTVTCVNAHGGKRVS